MSRGRKAQRTYAVTTSLLLLVAHACGSESDLPTREQEGLANTLEAEPAQEQRANHSKQKPGGDDEHGVPSTKTLVQWQLRPADIETTPRTRALAVVLFIGGTQTTVETGSVQGSCSIQDTHGELARMRCEHDGKGHDFIIKKESGGLNVYKKVWHRTELNQREQVPPKVEKIARVSLAPGTKVEFKSELLPFEP